MQGLDESIILFFQGIRVEALTLFFKLFIPLEIWYAIALVLVAYFFYRSKILRVPVISFILARSLSTICYNVAKDYFHRPRPFLTIPHAAAVITPHGYSFPSGHATLAMASAVVLSFHFPKARRLLYLLAVLTGVSRVYLGVHYLTDVLGGFVLGGVLGWAAIFLERGILALASGVRFDKKIVMIVMVLGSIASLADYSLAKGGDEQDQIILLNDSAAALEDSNPDLSKDLTKFADEKEKEWEISNANKAQPSTTVKSKNIAQVQERIKLLKAAAVAIEPTYPLIAKSLNKMAKDMNKTIELEE